MRRERNNQKSGLLRHPLPPVCGPDARWLILGSMPGVASLAAREYYAHPRNQFWPLMGALLGFDPSAPYEERLSALRHHRIALWDVIAECRRPGSLDADIDDATVRFHDLIDLVRRHPGIQAVAFNGREAERQFLRSGQHRDPRWPASIQRRSLPSTSPAMAMRSFSQKRAIWADFLGITPVSQKTNRGRSDC